LPSSSPCTVRGFSPRPSSSMFSDRASDMESWSLSPASDARTLILPSGSAPSAYSSPRSLPSASGVIIASSCARQVHRRGRPRLGRPTLVPLSACRCPDAPPCSRALHQLRMLAEHDHDLVKGGDVTLRQPQSLEGCVPADEVG